jgi:hypothetical protein
MGKAGVSNSVQLLRWAIRQGLVTVESSEVAAHSISVTKGASS